MIHEEGPEEPPLASFFIMQRAGKGQRATWAASVRGAGGCSCSSTGSADRRVACKELLIQGKLIRLIGSDMCVLGCN